MMLETLLKIAALAIVLVMIWHEEKFIKLEDKIKDRAAWCVAQVIVWYRRKKRNMIKGK